MTPSYSSTHLGPLGRTKELLALYRLKRANVPKQVRATLDRLETSDEEVTQDRGSRLLGGDVLVIGPGQHLAEMRFWSHAGNRVLGIDLDPYPSAPSPSDYVRMVRSDGAIRGLKTLARRATGIDAAYRDELSRQLASSDEGGYELLAMDAGAMRFADDTFDLVYSRSVFEHLREPGRAIAEIARVLKPGGVANIELHLYTCDGGCHDARIFAGAREELPYWAHLRPRYAERVRPNSYLNEIRFDEWISLFTRSWPGVELEHRTTKDQQAVAALPAIRAGGELLEYTDEELLTVGLVARWRRGT